MTHSSEDMTTYDYIVIGGGTSGAVAARRLAEGKDQYTVCLIEAGPRFLLAYINLLLESTDSFFS